MTFVITLISRRDRECFKSKSFATHAAAVAWAERHTNERDWLWSVEPTV